MEKKNIHTILEWQKQRGNINSTTNNNRSQPSTNRNSPLVLADMSGCVCVWAGVCTSQYLREYMRASERVDMYVCMHVNGRPNNRSDYDVQLMNRNSLWRFFLWFHLTNYSKIWSHSESIDKLLTMLSILLFGVVVSGTGQTAMATFVNVSHEINTKTHTRTHSPFIANLIWWAQCKWGRKFIGSNDIKPHTNTHTIFFWPARQTDRLWCLPFVCLLFFRSW